MFESNITSVGMLHQNANNKIVSTSLFQLDEICAIRRRSYDVTFRQRTTRTTPESRPTRDFGSHSFTL